MLIKFEGNLCRILELHHITPGNKRGHVLCKMRDIRSGRLMDNKFRAEDAAAIVRQCGFRVGAQWIDREAGFALTCADAS